jgi:uncharacterized membrane protein
VNSKKIITTAVFSLCAAVFICIGLYRYHLGQVFYYDFGIFIHTIWQLSRLQLPYIDHAVLGHVMFLGDHFNPGLLLFAPLFWLTSDPRILLIEQSLAITITGYLLYKIAYKQGLHYMLSCVVAAAYLIFAGTENPLVTDWHPEPTAAVFLVLCIYFLLTETKNARLWTYITALLFLSLKESNAISLVFVLIPLFLLTKNRRKDIVIVALAATGYFFLITRVVMPAIAQHPYIYSPQFPSSPLTLLSNMANSQMKTKLMYDSLIAYGFLPLLSLGIISVVLELAIRLAPSSTIFNNLTLGQHYNVYLGVFLALATIWTLKNIQKVTQKTKAYTLISILLALYLLVTSLYTARKITGSPINLAVNPTFWGELKPNARLFTALKQVPKRGSVMSQNNILAYLSNRSENLYLPLANYENKNPEIVVFDLAQNQNINNFYLSDYEVIKDIVKRLSQDQNYTRIPTADENIYIYIKK